MIQHFGHTPILTQKPSHQANLKTFKCQILTQTKHAKKVLGKLLKNILVLCLLYIYNKSLKRAQKP